MLVGSGNTENDDDRMRECRCEPPFCGIKEKFDLDSLPQMNAFKSTTDRERRLIAYEV